MAREWNANRSPLTHPLEKVESIRAAEGVAGSIIQEMRLSVKLLIKEFFDPLDEYYEKTQKLNALPETEA